MKTLKGNKIYTTTNPAKITDTQVRNVLRIKMTCGGGMGGASWYETVEPTTLKSNELLTVQDVITKEEKIINTNYVVNAQEKQLITITEVHQNHNFQETMGIPQKYYYLSKLGENIKTYNYCEDNWVI